MLVLSDPLDAIADFIIEGDIQGFEAHANLYKPQASNLLLTLDALRHLTVLRNCYINSGDTFPIDSYQQCESVCKSITAKQTPLSDDELCYIHWFADSLNSLIVTDERVSDDLIVRLVEFLKGKAQDAVFRREVYRLSANYRANFEMFDQALDDALEATKIEVDEPGKETQVYLYSTLAHIYTMLQRQTDALEALNICRLWVDDVLPPIRAMVRQSELWYLEEFVLDSERQQIKLCREIIGLQVSSINQSTYLAVMGRLQIDLGLYAEALQTLEMALEKDITSGLKHNVYLMAGIAAYCLESYRVALKYFNYPLPAQLSPDYVAMAEIYRGIVFEMFGYIRRAKLSYENALASGGCDAEQLKIVESKLKELKV